jgi:hypothetical protein
MSSRDKRIEMINGQLILIAEADGESFLRHGACEKKTRVSLNDLAGSPELFRRGEELLIKEYAKRGGQP